MNRGTNGEKIKLIGYQIFLVSVILKVPVYWYQLKIVLTHVDYRNTQIDTYLIVKTCIVEKPTQQHLFDVL